MVDGQAADLQTKSICINKDDFMVLALNKKLLSEAAIQELLYSDYEKCVA
jgi:hypothetical protein